MKSEIPSPKSDLALLCSQSWSKSGIPKSEVRDRTQSPTSPRSPSPASEIRAYGQSKAPQSQIRKSPSPAAPKRDSLEERVRNPKSDGALRRDRRQSERETPLVMSLMKSDRTKAPKSDRIVGYSITLFKPRRRSQL